MIKRTLTKRSVKIALRSSIAVLVVVAFALSGVGVYFALRDKAKKLVNNAPVETNPISWSTDKWNGSSSSGTEFYSDFARRGENSKTINSAASFIYFVNSVNDGETYEGKTIYLNKNIDLGGYEIKSIGSPVHPFKGTFDGGYFTIMNATVRGTGLFSTTENATIKNLGVYNVNIVSESGYVGGLVGSAFNTNIADCFFRLGKVEGKNNIGGLVGLFSSTNGTHRIETSFVDSYVNGKKTAGLAANISTNQSNENQVTISNCYYKLDTKSSSVSASGNPAVQVMDGASNSPYVVLDNVMEVSSKSQFANWNYTPKYADIKSRCNALLPAWCDYEFADGSVELSFDLPILSRFVKVYNNGSFYESTAVDFLSGEFYNIEDLREAVSDVSQGQLVEFNLLASEIMVEDAIEVNAGSKVIINSVVDTVVKKSNDDAENIFVAKEDSMLLLGETNGEHELIIDGNKNDVILNGWESGAAILSYNAGIQIYDNVTVKNNINNTDGIGGGIAVVGAPESEEVILAGGKVENCEAQYGGGIALLGLSAEIRTDVLSCSAELGGGLYLGSEGNVTSSLASRLKSLKNPTATKLAGPLTITNDYYLISKIKGCMAQNGGGVYVDFSTSQVSLSVGQGSSDRGYIQDCYASNNGGGICIRVQDTAYDGFAVASLILGEVYGNEAGTYGGGIGTHLQGEFRSIPLRSSFSLSSSCPVDGNTANYGGGVSAYVAGNYRVGVTGGISASSVYSNTANVAGNNTYECGKFNLESANTVYSCDVFPTVSGVDYWTANSDGSGTKYNPGTAYAAASNTSIGDNYASATLPNITLYAQTNSSGGGSSESEQYTVTLDKNGGTGGTSSVQATYGSDMPQITAPTRSGYRFNGYFYNSTKYYNADGTSARTWNYQEGKTLTASWTQVYTVTLNKNGGSGGTSSVTVAYGEDMPTISTPTRSSYVFLGYYDSSDVQYYNSNGASSRPWFLYSAGELTAHWTTRSKSVTFNKNGGTGGTSSITANYGQSMPTITAPSRTGYSFNGYYYDGTQYYYSNGSSAHTCDFLDGVTMVAIWTPNQYTVTLNSNGGTGGQSTVTATYGSAMPTLTSLPTKEGYDFAGYRYQSSSTLYYDSDGTSAHDWGFDSNNITLTAVWTGRQYSLSFIKNGGTGGNSSVIATYDSAMPTITVPTKNGYTFAGYYYNEVQYYDANGTSAHIWNVASEVELTASWTVVNYSITYVLNANNGSTEVTNGNVTTSYNILSSAINLTNASRTGYAFAGWKVTSFGGASANVKCNNSTVSVNDIITQIDSGSYGTIELTAQWTANTYTVRLDFKGGEASVNNSVPYGDAYITATFDQVLPSLTECLDSIPTKSGYVLYGFYYGNTAQNSAFYYSNTTQKYYDRNGESTFIYSLTEGIELNAYWFNVSTINKEAFKIWYWESYNSSNNIELTSFEVVTDISNDPIYTTSLSARKIQVGLADGIALDDVLVEYIYNDSAYLYAPFLGANNMKISMPSDSSGLFTAYLGTTLDLSDFDTQNVTNMSRMFYNSSVTSLDLSGFSTSLVTNMNGMFMDCEYLTSLDISNFNTYFVTDMSQMFERCSSLTNITFSNLGRFGNDVTTMQGMFAYCSSLTSLDLSSFKTANVTNMGAMFCGCSSLTSITFGSYFSTSNVTNMTGMFYNCSSLINLDLSCFDLSGCNQVDAVSFGSIDIHIYEQLTELVSFTSGTFYRREVDYYNGYYYYCEYYLLENQPDNWAYTYYEYYTRTERKSILKFLEGTASLESIKVPYNFGGMEIELPKPVYNLGLTAKYTTLTASNCQATASNACETYYTIDGFHIENNAVYLSGVTAAYFYAKELHFVNQLPANYQDMEQSYIGYPRNSGIFGDDCTACIIQYVDYTDLNNIIQYIYSPYSIYFMNGLTFSGGTWANIYFDNCNTSLMTSMSQLFKDCSSLTTLDLGGFDTSNTTNMSEMFSGCTSLQTIYFYGLRSNTSSEFIADYFYSYDGVNLNSITLLEEQPVDWAENYENYYYLVGWNTSNVTNMSNMFYGCSSITTLNLSPLDFSSSNGLDLTTMTSLDVVVAPYNIQSGTTISLPRNFFNSTTYEYIGQSLDNTICVATDSSECETFVSARVIPVRDNKVYFQFLNSETMEDVTEIHFVYEYSGVGSSFNVGYTVRHSDYVTDCIKATKYYDSQNETYILYVYSAYDIYLDNLTSGSFPSTITRFVFDNFHVDAETNLNNVFVSEYLDFSAIDFANATESNVENLISSPNILSVTMPYNLNPNYQLQMPWYQPISHSDWQIGHFFNSQTNKYIGGYYAGQKSTVYFKASEVYATSSSNCVTIVRYSLLTIKDNSVYFELNLLDNYGFASQPKEVYFTNIRPEGYESMTSYNVGTRGYAIFDTYYNINSSAGNHALDNFYSEDIAIMYRDGDIVYVYSPYTIKLTRNLNIVHTTSGSNNLYNFGGVEVVSFANADTSVITRMDELFDDYDGTTLDLSNFNTSNVTNMSRMFIWCNNLTSLDLSSFDTSNVTDFTDIFTYCNLTNLNVSGWVINENAHSNNIVIDNAVNVDASNWTINGNLFGLMFGMSSGVVNLDASDWTFVGTTSLAFMFNNTNITSIDVSGWDTSEITDMQGMFDYCNNLTSLDLSDWDTSSVTDMSIMFDGCWNLTSITFGEDWDTSSVTDMHGMFEDCQDLTSLDLSGWDTSNVTDFSGMFKNCYALVGDVTGLDFSSAVDLTEIFYDCNKLENIDFSTLNLADVSVNKLSNIYEYHSIQSPVDFQSGVYYGCEYSLLETEPTYWNDSNYYNNYYEFDEENGVFVELTGEREFEANKYYERSSIQILYSEPLDWSTSYSDYYTKVFTGYRDSAWISGCTSLKTLRVPYNASYYSYFKINIPVTLYDLTMNNTYTSMLTKSQMMANSPENTETYYSVYAFTPINNSVYINLDDVYNNIPGNNVTEIHFVNDVEDLPENYEELDAYDLGYVRKPLAENRESTTRTSDVVMYVEYITDEQENITEIHVYIYSQYDIYLVGSTGFNYALTSVTFDNLNLSEWSSLYGLFGDCSNLTTIDLSNVALPDTTESSYNIFNSALQTLVLPANIPNGLTMGLPYGYYYQDNSTYEIVTSVVGNGSNPSFTLNKGIAVEVTDYRALFTISGNYLLDNNYSSPYGETYYVVPNEEITLSISGNTLGFEGWYDSSNQLLSDQTSYTFSPSANASIHVGYISDGTVSVEARSNTVGTPLVNGSISVSVNPGSQLTFTTSPVSGYKFCGWSYDDTGFNIISTDYEYSTISSTEDIILYAIYEETLLLTDTMPSGGSVEITNLTTSNLVYNNSPVSVGDEIEFTITIDDGFEFCGWYSSSTFDEQTFVSSSLTYTLTAVVGHNALYPKVQLCENTVIYTITYSINDSSLLPYISTTNIYHDEVNEIDYAIANSFINIVLSLYDNTIVFAGWYADADYTQLIGVSGMYSTTITSNLTIYALVLPVEVDEFEQPVMKNFATQDLTGNISGSCNISFNDSNYVEIQPPTQVSFGTHIMVNTNASGVESVDATLSRYRRNVSANYLAVSSVLYELNDGVYTFVDSEPVDFANSYSDYYILETISGEIFDGELTEFKIIGDTMYTYQAFGTSGYELNYIYDDTMGSVSFSPSHITPSAIPEGEKVSVTAIANEGYTFDGWYSYDGNDYSLLSKSIKYSLVMNADTTIYANFRATTESTWTLTWSDLSVSQDMGSVSFYTPDEFWNPEYGFGGQYVDIQSPYTNISDGSIIIMSFQPYSGCKLDTLTINGISHIEFINGGYIYFAINSNSTITYSFASIFPLTANIHAETNNGYDSSITLGASVDGIEQLDLSLVSIASANTEISLTAEEIEGSIFLGWKIVDQNSNYTTIAGRDDCTLNNGIYSVTLTLENYLNNVNQSSIEIVAMYTDYISIWANSFQDGATITVYIDGVEEQNPQANANSTITLTATEVEGVGFNGWYIGEEKVIGASISDGCTLYCEYEDGVYTVTFTLADIAEFLTERYVSMEARYGSGGDTPVTQYIVTVNEQQLDPSNPSSYGSVAIYTYEDGMYTESQTNTFNSGSTIYIAAQPYMDCNFVAWIVGYDGSTYLPVGELDTTSGYYMYAITVTGNSDFYAVFVPDVAGYVIVAEDFANPNNGMAAIYDGTAEEPEDMFLGFALVQPESSITLAAAETVSGYVFDGWYSDNLDGTFTFLGKADNSEPATVGLMVNDEYGEYDGWMLNITPTSHMVVRARFVSQYSGETIRIILHGATQDTATITVDSNSPSDVIAITGEEESFVFGVTSETSQFVGWYFDDDRQHSAGVTNGDSYDLSDMMSMLQTNMSYISRNAQGELLIYAEFDVNDYQLTLEDYLFSYTGSEIEPEVEVTLNGVTLNSNDYEVAYSNNETIGLATVTVTITSSGVILTDEFTIAPAIEQINGNENCSAEIEVRDSGDVFIVIQTDLLKVFGGVYADDEFETQLFYGTNFSYSYADSNWSHEVTEQEFTYLIMNSYNTLYIRYYDLALATVNGVETQVRTNVIGGVTKLSATLPAGYTFGGWFADYTGLNEVINASISDKIGSAYNCDMNDWYKLTLTNNGTYTLYAKFTPKTFTVTFNYNGGTGSTESTTVSYNGSVELPAASRDGDYEFDGWYLSDTRVGYAGDNYTHTSNSNVTLVAHWNSVEPEYSITYHLNDEYGSPATNNINNRTENFTSEDLPIALYAPERDSNYIFLGWYTSNDFTTQVTSIPVGTTSDVELYALWVEIAPSEYQALVSRDGGDGNCLAAAAYTLIDIGEEQPDNVIFVIAKESEGYDFVKWYYVDDEQVEQTISVLEYNGYYFHKVTDAEMEEIMSAENRVWLAQFEAEPTGYTVTYHNLDSTTTATFMEAPYELATLVDVPNGYSAFVGWYDNENFNGDAITTISTLEDIELWAKWTPITYTITYHMNDELGYPDTNNDGNPATYTVETSTITLLDPIGEEDYYFLGWFMDTDQETAHPYDTRVATIPQGTTGNIELYALWVEVADEEYQALVAKDGGDENCIAAAVFTLLPVENAQPTPVILVMATATSDSYDFVRWYYEDNEEVEHTISSLEYNGYHYHFVTDEEMNDIAEYHNIWYAEFETLTSYSITYNMNGEFGYPTTNNESNPNSFTIKTPTITLLDPIGEEGYYFLGWFMDTDQETAHPYDTRVATIPQGTTGDIDLYALWVEIADEEYQALVANDGGNGNCIAAAVFTLLPVENAAPTPVILVMAYASEGYNFVKWYYEDNEVEYIISSVEYNGYYYHFVTDEEMDDIAENHNVWNAQFSETSYTITYNNVDGATNYNQSTFVASDLDLTLLNPIKTFYTFNGWYDNEQLTGDPITTIGTTGNKELWASWSLTNYTILPDDRTAYGYPSISSTTITVEDAPYTLLGETDEDYIFLGWFLDTDAETDHPYDTPVTQITSEMLASLPEGITTINIYALWIDIADDEYQTLVANEGGDENCIAAAVYTLLPVENAMPTPVIFVLAHASNNYSFVRWYYEDKEEVEHTISSLEYNGYYFHQVTDEEMEEITGGNTGIWYAEYTSLAYSITYNNVQGATNSNPVEFTEDDLALGITLVDLSRTYYTFNGWYDNAQLTGDPITTISTTGNKELWASWSLISYTILPDDRTAYGYPSINSMTITVEDAPYTLPVESEEDYIFLGWFLDTDAETDHPYDTEITQITSDMLASLSEGVTTINIYALWVEIAPAEYQQLIQKVGGNNDCLAAAAYTLLPVENDEPENVIFVVAKESQNSNFIRLYYTDLEGDQTISTTSYNGYLYHMVTDDEMADIMMNMNVWYIEFTSSITYHLNDTYASDGETLSISAATNDANNPTTFTYQNLDLTISAPSRIGYTFNGWYDNEELTGSPVTSIETAGNIELWASWSVITYTLQPDDRSAYGYPVTSAMTFTVEDTTYVITPGVDDEDNIFLGWFLDTDDETTHPYDTEITQITMSDIAALDGTTINIYALWVEIAPAEYQQLIQKVGGNNDCLAAAAYTLLPVENDEPENVILVVMKGTENLDFIRLFYTVDEVDHTITTTSYNGYNYHLVTDDEMGDIMNGDTGVWYAEFETPQSYNIVYVLNDDIDTPATNNANNPSTFVEDDLDLTLYAPTRVNGEDDVYVFIGWWFIVDENNQYLINSIPAESFSLMLDANDTITLNALWVIVAPEEYQALVHVETGDENCYAFAAYTLDEEDEPENFYVVAIPGGNYEFSRFYYIDLSNYQEVSVVAQETCGTYFYQISEEQLMAVMNEETSYWIVEFSGQQTVTYTVTYDYDGGTGNIDSVDVEENGTTTLPSGTKSGYTLEGWYLNNVKVGIAGASYTVTGDVTLVAHWTATSPTMYTVTYNYNGGSGMPPSVMVQANNSTMLPTPTNSGYTFDGWYLNNTKVGVGGSYYTPTGNVTLVAHWISGGAQTQYTVTYNFNGGSGGPPFATVQAGSSTVLPNGTKSGYTLEGWYLNDTKVGNAGASYLVTASVTLVANWVEGGSQVAGYTITYDFNGGMGGPSSATVQAGSSTQLPNGTKSGYTLEGWYLNSVKVGNANASYTPSGNISAITLVANWVVAAQPTTYSVMISKENMSDANGILTNNNLTPMQGNITANTSITLFAADKDGYTFDGWYTYTNTYGEEVPSTTVNDSYVFTYNAVQYKGMLSTITVNSNMTIRAKYSETQQVTTYSVTVADYTNYNNGISGILVSGDLETGPVDVEEGNSVTLIAIANEGYTFDGWYIDGNESSIGTGETFENYEIGNSSYSGWIYTYMPTADVTIRAKFVEIVVPPTTYTVTVADYTNYSNGTSGFYVNDAFTTDSQQVTAGDSVILIAMPSSGYSFAGWYEDGNESSIGTGETFENYEIGNSSYSGWIYSYMPTADVTIRAKFVEIVVTYTVSVGSLPNEISSVEYRNTANSGNQDGGWITLSSFEFDTSIYYDFKATAIANYQVASIVVTRSDSTVVTPVEGHYQFETGYNYVVTATAEQIPVVVYKVSANDPLPSHVTAIEYSTDGTNYSTLNANGFEFTPATTYYFRATFETGYQFTAWSITPAANVTTVLSGNPIQVSFAAEHNYTVSLTASAITYTVDYDLGDDQQDSGTYNIEQSLTLSTPTRTDYKFMGWRIVTMAGVIGESSVGDLISTIPVGSYGNVSLEAVWGWELKLTYTDNSSLEADRYISDFTFIDAESEDELTPLVLINGAEPQNELVIDSDFDPSETSIVVEATFNILQFAYSFANSPVNGLYDIIVVKHGNDVIHSDFSGSDSSVDPVEVQLYTINSNEEAVLNTNMFLNGEINLSVEFKNGVPAVIDMSEIDLGVESGVSILPIVDNDSIIERDVKGQATQVADSSADEIMFAVQMNELAIDDYYFFGMTYETHNDYIKNTSSVYEANKYYHLDVGEFTSEPEDWEEEYKNYYTLDENGNYIANTSSVYDNTKSYYRIEATLLDSQEAPDQAEWEANFANYFVLGTELNFIAPDEIHDDNFSFVRTESVNNGMRFVYRTSKISDLKSLIIREPVSNINFNVKKIPDNATVALVSNDNVVIPLYKSTTSYTLYTGEWTVESTGCTEEKLRDIFSNVAGISFNSSSITYIDVVDEIDLTLIKLGGTSNCKVELVEDGDDVYLVATSDGSGNHNFMGWYSDEGHANQIIAPGAPNGNVWTYQIQDGDFDSLVASAQNGEMVIYGWFEGVEDYVQVVKTSKA